MADTQLKDQKNFTSSLISALALLQQVPMREQVEMKANGPAAVMDHEAAAMALKPGWACLQGVAAR